MFQKLAEDSSDFTGDDIGRVVYRACAVAVLRDEKDRFLRPKDLSDMLEIETQKGKGALSAIETRMYI